MTDHTPIDPLDAVHDLSQELSTLLAVAVFLGK
jgi:hypothetical protein